MFSLSNDKDLFYLRIWRLSFSYLKVHQVKRLISLINFIGIGFHLRIWRLCFTMTPTHNIRGNYIPYQTI